MQGVDIPPSSPQPEKDRAPADRVHPLMERATGLSGEGCNRGWGQYPMVTCPARGPDQRAGMSKPLPLSTLPCYSLAMRGECFFAPGCLYR